MKRTIAAAAAMVAALAQGAWCGPAAAQDRPDQRAFLDLYREMVETDTTLSRGSCTRAAGQVAARLTAAGYPQDDVVLFSDPGHPREGGVVATLRGQDAGAQAMLLLGHLDVVEADPKDWTRDPFKLVQEGGYYYARGTVDDKAMSAVWADTMVRLKQSGVTPRRTIRMALTCGEETTYAWNGAQYLATRRPELIAADFALNEGGGGRLDADGRRRMLAIQVGEKAAQNYTMVATDPGGHSSQPTPATAITRMADAIKAVQRYEFPVRFTDTTRAYFKAATDMQGGETGAAIAKLLADPTDAAADRIVSRDKGYHSTLRTTCVVTLVDAGHAENALPQRATANVNCRIFPGETVEGTLTTLRGLAGPDVAVSANQPVRPVAVPPRLDPAIVEPATRLAARHFPGVPVVPIMSTGATDAVFLGQAKIPVYGVPGFFIDRDTSGTHGLNERIAVRSLYDGRDYLYDLVRAYAGA